MKEKFAGALRFEIGAVAVAVRGDVKRVEPSFTVFDFTIGVGQIATARTKGFNFCARKDDSGFDRLGYGEVMAGFPVLDFNRFQGASPRATGGVRRTSWRGFYARAYRGCLWRGRRGLRSRVCHRRLRAGRHP